MTSHLKRERQAKIDKLTREFQLLSKSHKLNPDRDSLDQLEAARLSLNLAITTEA